MLKIRDLIKRYIDIRNGRNELREKYDVADGKLSAKLDEVKRQLLNFCEENNLNGLKTPEGSLSVTDKTSYWTDDWDSLREFVLEHGVTEFFEKRLHQGNIQEFLEDNPELVPKGLSVRKEHTISVRKAK
jgi:hypothetical protein|tara:strand:- start:2615 stop:3004 length:390 start_codon:yes stop_codon:yes gene_type:complete